MTCRPLLLGTALALLAASPAAADSRLVIRGGGWGHGVGMSQYGAYGFAQHGSSYRQILGHYYTGTSIGKLPRGRVVRVLLQGDRGSARFSGATSAAGRRLNPSRTYGVRRGPGTTVELLSPTGRRMKRVSAPLRAKGRGPLKLRGTALNGRTDGRYRGSLEFRPGAYMGVQAINAVGLETYLRGVVPDEMPPSWHPEALKAQAVAARSYAVTTGRAGNGWEQYPDTRSQVYGGVAAEERSTNAAIAATAGEVVTHGGEPVTTFFFSTSGGRTEDVENTPLGTGPKPWLKSVDDPYDDISPRHRWGPIRMSLRTAGRKLGGLVKGSFRGIKVLDRGKSPRIVSADIVGTGGRTRVSGATLRARLGLFDTWAYFTTVTTNGDEPDPDPEPTPEPTPTPPPQSDPSGGVGPGARASLQHPRTLRGSVFPFTKGADVEVQVLRGRRWQRAGLPTLDREGRFVFATHEAGRYRVVYRGVTGPVVRVG